VSSSKLAFGSIVVLAWATFALPVPPQQAHGAEPGLSCPAHVTIAETATSAEGWTVRGSQAEKPFERISVFNKDSAHEYDLAPDGQKQDGSKVSQTWELNSYRTLPLFLTCRYRGTAVVLVKELPRSVATCTLSFRTDRNGEITGASTMVCK
jgi:hypothetical protein